MAEHTLCKQAQYASSYAALSIALGALIDAVEYMGDTSPSMRADVVAARRRIADVRHNYGVAAGLLTTGSEEIDRATRERVS